MVFMMKWRSWSPVSSKKFRVKLSLLRIEGFNADNLLDLSTLWTEIRWKGPKTTLTFMRSVQKNFTKEEQLNENGVVIWNEEFQNVCSLSFCKDNTFQPWEISFTINNVLRQAPKDKIHVVGTASLNLGQYVSMAEGIEFEINIPVCFANLLADSQPSLYISINLLELRSENGLSLSYMEKRSVVPVSVSPISEDSSSHKKKEVSALKAGLRIVKMLTTGYRIAKNTCQGEEFSDQKCCTKSDDVEFTHSCDIETDDSCERESEDDGKEGISISKSCSYGTLSVINHVGSNAKNEDMVYYSNRNSYYEYSNNDEPTSSMREQTSFQLTKRSILSWRKRKLSLRSPRSKGEPLLNKSYGEDGGDDIDFDRRQLSSSDESILGWYYRANENQLALSEFGDDQFAVGSWEQKEVISRDGNLKLCTKMFFASIDQCSERAAGESACTALVAVIADWFQCNPGEMPIKSQFDSLIREGSLAWRNLCEKDEYHTRFPDGHFDLETILEAKIGSLSIDSDKSFIGFFDPICLDDDLEFLHDAMSFDSIWEAISLAGSNCDNIGVPQVYIVSWNDHFFILKVESEAYYIIDTLGERLYEGCNQAYILKFDKDTLILKIPDQKEIVNAKNPKTNEGSVRDKKEFRQCTYENDIICRGRESCRAYIRDFLAAIPIRELQADIKKSLNSLTLIHHRLQVEFHYTKLLIAINSFLPEIPTPNLT